MRGLTGAAAAMEPRPRGIPLVPDRHALHAGALGAFFRAIIVSARSRIDRKGRTPIELAQKIYPHDQQLDLLLRAPVTPDSTTSSAQVVSPITYEYLDALTPLSAAASLIGASPRLRFGSGRQISVPGFAAIPALEFVAEGAPMPVVMGTTNRLILNLYKMAGIIALSRELYEHSHAENRLRQAVTAYSAFALDVALFSQVAADSTRPAGLFNGVAPLTPAANTFKLDNLVEDLGILAEAVGAYSGNGQVAFVAAPAQYTAIRLRAAKPLEFPVWQSMALPNGTVACIALPTFVSAVGDTPDFDFSTNAALTTTDPGEEFATAAGVVGAPTQTSFQADLIGLRLRLPLSWGLRAAGVSWLQNAAW
jgi:hypothetical protein